MTVVGATALVLSTAAAGTQPTGMTSTNWSGYIVDGGPYAVATATFNVPNLTAAAEKTATAEWVGIDGSDPKDGSLIQAGITEEYDPTDNLVHFHAWWEILPALATDVPLPVTAGDRVRVSIGQLTTGRWRIEIENLTRHRQFVTTRAYSGAGRTADWIVEAPSDGHRRVKTLGHFVPDVTFRNVRVGGTLGEVHAVTMVQRGVVVSKASPLTTSGFRVTYG